MKQNKIIVGIEDAKIGIVNMITAETEGVAIRTFGEACTQTDKPKNDFQKFPADFRLMYLGEIEIETGIIKPSIPPRTLAQATQYNKIEIKNTEDKE